MAKRHANRGLRKLCACGRRTWAKCPHPWHFNFKWRDQHHRFSLDKHLGRRIEGKTEAENEAEALRVAIKAGTFGQPTPVAAMTLRNLAQLYVERAKPNARAELDLIGRTVVEGRPFGERPLADIVTGTIREFQRVRRAAGSFAANRNLARLSALFNWALEEGYLTHMPFKQHGKTVVRFDREDTRSRRLNADIDEEGKLLAACPPHLRAIVECALETGMRRGEILSLQWPQVEGMTVDGPAIAWAARPTIVLPAGKTKTKRERRIPISARLRGVLELRRFDPRGDPLPPGAYVFGTAIGTRVTGFKRAWMTAVLRAHGHEPTYTATANLTPALRAAFREIGLHFHDLRREAGSRWLEGGVPIHVVRDWLGHTNVSQTSTYLAGTLKTAHDAMAAYERRLQQLATEVGKRGQSRRRTTTPTTKKHNKTTGDHGPAVM